MGGWVCVGRECGAVAARTRELLCQGRATTATGDGGLVRRATSARMREFTGMKSGAHRSFAIWAAGAGEGWLTTHKATTSNRPAEQAQRSAPSEHPVEPLERRAFPSAKIRWRVQKFKPRPFPNQAKSSASSLGRRSSDYFLQKVVVNLSVEIRKSGGG